MKLNIFATLFVLGASQAIAASPAPQAIPPALHGHDLLIAIDMTGSMADIVRLPSGATATTFDVAKSAALGWLASQPTDNSGTPGVTTPTPTQVSIWKFQGDGYTLIQPFT